MLRVCLKTELSNTLIVIRDQIGNPTLYSFVSLREPRSERDREKLRGN